MDHGDKERVRDRNKKLELEEERVLAQLEHVLSSYDGRALFWDILSVCRIYNSPSNSEYILREIGRQDVGKIVLDMIFKANPHAYTTMRQEAENRMNKIND